MSQHRSAHGSWSAASRDGGRELSDAVGFNKEGHGVDSGTYKSLGHRDYGSVSREGTNFPVHSEKAGEARSKSCVSLTPNAEKGAEEFQRKVQAFVSENAAMIDALAKQAVKEEGPKTPTLHNFQGEKTCKLAYSRCGGIDNVFTALQISMLSQRHWSFI